MVNFENQTAIVTGGTRGIGRAIADGMARLGGRVIVTGTQARCATELPSAWEYRQLDFLHEATVAAFLAGLDQVPHIDVLVNNAGINIIEPIDELSEEHWQQVITVNLTGPARLTQYVARRMKAQQAGRIVNISSIWGVHSRAQRNAYSASKTGLLGLTRACALDLAKERVLVNAVCPGFTKTELTDAILSAAEQQDLEARIPLRRFATADEIAKVVLFLGSAANTYVTGQTIVVDGGYTIQ